MNSEEISAGHRHFGGTLQKTNRTYEVTDEHAPKIC